MNNLFLLPHAFVISLFFMLPSFCQELIPAREICNDPSIKTIQIHSRDWDFSMPVIFFKEGEKLVLRFDRLGDEDYDYSFSVSYCTWDWKIKELPEHIFMNGFNDVSVYNKESSFNTTRYFNHYSVTIPTEELQLLVSGNYLVTVYKTGEPDDVAFTRRFCLAERLTEISARINKPDLQNQEVMMKIDLGDLNLMNPLAEVKVAVIKNFDWNNEIDISSLPLLRNHVLYLDMPYQIMANGGNEFRYFDIKSTKFVSERVERIDYRAPEYHFLLKTDKLKQYAPYFSSKDLNGMFYTEVNDSHNRHLDADYVNVHFALEVSEAFPMDVYLYGALTGWALNENTYMTYNPAEGLYEKTLLLKQGYYNYAYVLKDYNKKEISVDVTEGNHSETENDYFVFVYLKKVISDFDRLVGYKVINSVGKESINR